MSHDQCPSTVNEGPKQRPSKEQLQAAAGRSLRRTVNGMNAWRSDEEVADTAEFREFLHREFPAGASELLQTSRRSFMQFMGASVALAGAATIPGCRRPDHKILPYSKSVPEDIIPGKPLYYASALPLPGGGAEGLLVETHEGRPTKVEGNPLHPINQGKSSVIAQASILDLYDPDRLKFPLFRAPAGVKEASWDDFAKKWAPGHFAKFDAVRGKGLAIIVDKKTSPTRDVLRDKARRVKWPLADWIEYESYENVASIEGAKIAFGSPMRDLINFAGAKVILTLDRDFLSGEADSLVHARGFASGRVPKKTGEKQYAMNRLYAIESGFGTTGAQADHRLRLSPGRVIAAAAALAKYILPKVADAGSKVVADAADKLAVSGLSVEEVRFVETVAKDLLDTANRGKALVVAGPTLPAEVHALCHAINARLDAVGTLVRFLPVDDVRAKDSHKALADLAAKMAKGEVDTIVCIGTNPCYDAPGELKFEELYKKVPTTVSLNVQATETGEASTWALNGAHFLEAWGDVEAHDGTISPVQPMIAPLYGHVPTLDELKLPEKERPASVMSEIELLNFLLTGEVRSGYDLVRDSWKAQIKGDFDKAWRRALHDGLLAGTTQKGAAPAPQFAKIAEAAAALKIPAPAAPGSMDVVFQVSRVHDGRFANNPWLQELPQTGTRIVWDNPVLMSPTTAIKLGLYEKGVNRYTADKYPRAEMAEVTVNGKTSAIAVWILPGMAEDTMILTLGYGRRVAGRVGDGVGFDVASLRGAGSSLIASGATAKKTAGDYWVASTQNHWSMESRTSIVRAIDLPAFEKFADEIEPKHDEIYGTPGEPLNLGERLGELAEGKPNLSIYENPYSKSKAAAAAGSRFTEKPQWGMTIDLSSCTGCGACTIACQAENNIPVIGKKEVAKGREMAWIRVDRYYTGWNEGDSEDKLANPDEMLHQPVACVHCENAPCETVCPVNATVHGPEGINYMAYNRCIGTRYCANNCPYKVRRFNFFDYGVTKFNGDYFGKTGVESVSKVLPFDKSGATGSTKYNLVNPNLIPPRLRDKLDEISRMQKNPDVTVRSRGVMEKCSYCIQRINAARIEINLREDLDPKFRNQVPDGFFQVACQQACPSDAITFGDILDADTEYANEDGTKRKGSKVFATRKDPRSYALLGYLNTRPRTSHMVKVRNPNRELCTAERVKGWDNPFEHAGAHEGAGHEGGHGSTPENGHQAPKGEAKPHAFIDPRKTHQDAGYSLSLRVLSGVQA